METVLRPSNPSTNMSSKRRRGFRGGRNRGCVGGGVRFSGKVDNRAIAGRGETEGAITSHHIKREWLMDIYCFSDQYRSDVSDHSEDA